MGKTVYGIAWALIGCLLTSSAVAQDTEATTKLKARSAEFDRDIIEVADGVYAAIGYGASVFSMIVGDDGVIIVDTGQDARWSAEARREFEKISDKPIKAIIYTHAHGDHINGATAFVDPGEPQQIWARANFGAETAGLGEAGLTINRVRGARQAGFKLPPDKRINNGVAPAVYPNAGRDAFNPEAVSLAPNRTFDEERRRLRIAGVALELVANPGETEDQLYVWLPDRKVIFAGDNFYKSWPNLYAIRGTSYRDVRDWAEAVERLLLEEPAVLVGGHTRPIAGKELVKQVLSDYRDGIRYVFDKTIEGMNKGLTPDQLVAYARLPKNLADKDYLAPYYGHPDWAVRAIFTGYLGWFDGNPTNLFPLSPKQEAQRMVTLAGGTVKLLDAARVALDSGDAQWAAQLSDYLIALGGKLPEAKKIKASALERLAQNVLTATARNYYLTVAQELKSKSVSGGP